MTLEEACIVFGIKPNSIEKVKEKYRELVKTHHPDVGGDVNEFHRIQDAYEVLSNIKEYYTVQDSNSILSWDSFYQHIRKSNAFTYSSISYLAASEEDKKLLNRWISMAVSIGYFLRNDMGWFMKMYLPHDLTISRFYWAWASLKLDTTDPLYKRYEELFIMSNKGKLF